MGMLMTDETGKRIAGALEMMSASSYAEMLDDYKSIQKIVRQGGAADVFAIGDQILTEYTASDGVTKYAMPWDIVKFGEVTLEDGETVPGMFLQSHYATLEAVQYDHAENEKVTEETYQDDLTYYVPNGDSYTRLVKGTDYQVGDTITNRNTVHSAINDSSINICRYGYNRWKHSAIRQWLNSDKAAGQWWTAQHTGDVAPDQLNSIRGFLAGLPAEFVEVLGKPKMTQALNTVSEPDKTLTEEDTYDKMFLASLEQMYTTPQVGSGKEGTYFDYWKRALGLSSPSSWHPSTYEAYKTYALENHNSAQSVRLRSALRGYSYSPWDVNSGGSIYSYHAGYALRSAPVCVIC